MGIVLVSFVGKEKEKSHAIMNSNPPSTSEKVDLSFQFRCKKVIMEN